jgi:hypothetical protein
MYKMSIFLLMSNLFFGTVFSGNINWMQVDLIILWTSFWKHQLNLPGLCGISPYPDLPRPTKLRPTKIQPHQITPYNSP